MTLDSPEDFKRFSVHVDGRPADHPRIRDAVMHAGNLVDAETMWVKEAWLRNAPGRIDTSAWQDGVSAMITAAQRYGWIDEATRSIKAHVVWADAIASFHHQSDHNMNPLNLETATRLVDSALQKGREIKAAPLCVVVLDAGGHLIVAKREDGASLLRPDIATGKAYGCLAMGFGGRELARRAKTSAPFLAALSGLTGGKVVPVPGGVLIRDHDGVLLGAVGISGDTSPTDEECALAGIASVALVADTGDSA
ncbi:GlcG/HbpS family heme-binding protein [Burkholderia sp. MR1-5-21]